MRVTGGRARGIPIKAPKGMLTRPTSDKVREALFETLGAHVLDAQVLDLFAGSGALGIEALSRGAGFAVFVDNSTCAARIIKDNLAKTRFSEKGEVLRADFRLALEKLEKAGKTFGLMFVDPPYEGDWLVEVVAHIEKHRITHSGTIIVAEHFKKTESPAAISGIPLVRTRAYGQTALSYYSTSTEWV
jgi:16S rRNA (guanine966-N2)-methyltransferase